MTVITREWLTNFLRNSSDLDDMPPIGRRKKTEVFFVQSVRQPFALAGPTANTVAMPLPHHREVVFMHHFLGTTEATNRPTRTLGGALAAAGLRHRTASNVALGAPVYVQSPPERAPRA
jgi:hypothetical protein